MTRSLLVVGPALEPSVAERLARREIDVAHRPTATAADLRAIAPRAVLVEWELESGSGAGICGRLKRDPKRSTTWVILASLHREALEEHAQTSETPADAYLQRPFTADALERALGPSGLLELGAGGDPDADGGLDLDALNEADGLVVAGAEEHRPPDAGGIEADPEASDAPGVTVEAARAKLKALAAAPEGAPPHRASPEERVQWLRAHARELEARSQGLMELVEALLATKASDDAAQSAAQARVRDLEAALELERAETEKVRRAFESYEAEVHRVVQQKRAEERAAAEALTTARERITALEQAARDDAQRREIMASELARLDDAAQAEQRAAEALSSELAQRTEAVAALEARVEAADRLVDEMQNEVMALRAKTQRDADVEARVGTLQARLERWKNLAAELERALAAGLT